MPENCALYLSTRLAPSPSLMQSLAPGAELSAFRPPPGENCAPIELEWPDVHVRINRMDRGSAGLAQHLEGFQGYAWKLAGQEMDARVHELLERIARTHHVLGIIIEPGFDDGGKVWALVRGLASAHGGLVFWNSSILDPQLRYYLASTGGHDPAAELPVLPSALERKARSEARLQAMGVPFVTHLPAVPGDEEAVLRNGRDVALRAAALMVVAFRGEGMEQARAVSILREVGMWDAASPKEQAFLMEMHPQKQELVNFRWRYEALWVMPWALGHVDLGPPTVICDVPKAAGLIRELGLREMVGAAKLRALSEILDELDFTYRCHWAVVDARVNDKEAPGGVDPGVVYERHYALNWLTVHGRAEWDDVSTDT